jgi:molecular chaperone GrpE (heat shock protein)
MVEINFTNENTDIQPTVSPQEKAGGVEIGDVVETVFDTVEQSVAEEGIVSEQTFNASLAENGGTETDNPKDNSEILILLRQLAKDFEVKLKYDTSKQEQVDKLYKENMDYKAGILEKFKRSLILAVIEPIDAAEKQITFFSNTEFSKENYDKLLTNYSETAVDFQNMLLQQFDVAVFRSEPDTPFDAKRQRSLKTISTVNPAKHKLVSKSLRPGYEIDSGNGDVVVLRPEMVEVYVCQTQNQSP